MRILGLLLLLSVDPVQIGKVDDKTIYRFVDEQYGTICYIVSFGYSIHEPAITCVKK